MYIYIYIALYAKKWLKTTETFSNLETSPYIHRNPIKYVCSHNQTILLKFICASALQHGSSYMIFVFLPSYLSSDVLRGRENDGFIDEYSYSYNCINSVLFLPLCVIVGYYVDRIGTMPFLSISSVIVIFASPFLFYGLSISTSSTMNWFLQFLLVLSCVPIWGCIFYWYISQLLPDPRTRVTIYGVGYNLGAAIFGGTATLIASSFVSSMGPINGMIWSGIWMSIMALLCITTCGYIYLFEKNEKDTPKHGKFAAEKFTLNNKDIFTSTSYLNPKYNHLDTIQEANCEDITDYTE